MKKMIPVILLTVFALNVNAQINNPVIWSYSAKKIADKTYKLHLTAPMNRNWHVYGLGSGATGMEPATSISFIKNPLVIFEGNMLEVGQPVEYYDKHFKSVLNYYNHTVDFVQTIKLRSAMATVVKGKANYIVCNDRSYLPPKDVPFTIPVGRS